MFRRLFETPHKRAERLAAALRWPVLEKSQHAIAQDAVASAAADALARDGIEGFLAFYQEAFESRATAGDHMRCYALAEPVATLEWDDPDITAGRAQLKLRIYEQAFQDCPQRAAASALYGRALLSLATIQTGESWPERLAPVSGEKRGQYAALAHEVFEAARNEAADCPLWHRTRFFCGVTEGCTPEALRRRFEIALGFDPEEPALYTTRACQLLPSWYGSFEEIEAFARTSCDRTEAELGGTMYARIYAAVGRERDLRETDADWTRLKASMEAWCRSSPSQRQLNEFAAMADLFGDEPTLANLLETRINAYDPGAWYSAEQAADVMARLAPRR